MKIELDEKTIDNIVNYFLKNPDKIRKILHMMGKETLSILREQKILDEGASLYREITKAINETYKRE